MEICIADTFDLPEEIFLLQLSFHIEGSFRLSQNTSVLGHVGAVGGLAVAVGSQQALVLAVSIVGWCSLKLYAEEPALRRAYGSRHRCYTARIAQ